MVNIPKALLKDEDNKELTRPVAPFNISFNTRLNLFQWLELPGNEERLTRFKYAMTGSRHSETKEGILRGELSSYTPPILNCFDRQLDFARV